MEKNNTVDFSSAEEFVKLWNENADSEHDSITHASILLAVMESLAQHINATEAARLNARKMQLIHRFNAQRNTVDPITPTKSNSLGIRPTRLRHWFIYRAKQFRTSTPSWQWATIALFIIITSPIVWMLQPKKSDFEAVGLRADLPQIAIIDFDANPPQIITELQATGAKVHWKRNAGKIEMSATFGSDIQATELWKKKWDVKSAQLASVNLLIIQKH